MFVDDFLEAIKVNQQLVTIKGSKLEVLVVGLSVEFTTEYRRTRGLDLADESQTEKLDKSDDWVYEVIAFSVRDPKDPTKQVLTRDHIVAMKQARPLAIGQLYNTAMDLSTRVEAEINGLFQTTLS